MVDNTPDADFEVTAIYQIQLPVPPKNSANLGHGFRIERQIENTHAESAANRKKAKTAAREATMQKNFDKLIDEGMLLLEGEEADRRYTEIWEKVKRMQKLQETQEGFMPAI